MKQMLRSDWSPERARYHRSGFAALFPKGDFHLFGKLALFFFIVFAFYVPKLGK